VEKRYYSAASLRRVLEDLERAYGMTSPEFYDAYVADEVPARVSRFHRHVWASFYRDVRRLEHADFSDSAREVLALG
jgi:hypothetical protein